LIKDELSLDVGSAQKDGSDCGDVSQMPLGSSPMTHLPSGWGLSPCSIMMRTKWLKWKC